MKSRLPIHMVFILLAFIALACRLPGSRGNSTEATETGTNGPTTATTEQTPSMVEAAPGEESPPAGQAEPVPAAHLDRFLINQAAHPEALCNDGTTPVFYFRRGIGSGTDKWIIWFKGGGTGWSAETFQNRGATVTSNTPWMTEAFAQLGSGGNQGSPDGEAGGIMSSVPDENPDFFNWNHVYLVYCSSDGWTGTQPASPATGGMHFAGHHIVNAMFAALQDPEIVGSPNLADATQIILSGSSAGALGLRANLDRLAADLAFADVRAISDAGVFLWGNPDFQPEFEAAVSQQYAAWQPILDEDCVQANGDAPWNCLSGGFLVANGYIQTPMFIHQDQSDIKLQEAFQSRGFDVAEGVRLVGAATRPLLETQDGVFSPNAGRHIIVNTNRFNGFRLDQLTFATVFGNWYFDRPGPTVLIEYP